MIKKIFFYNKKNNLYYFFKNNINKLKIYIYFLSNKYYKIYF